MRGGGALPREQDIDEDGAEQERQREYVEHLRQVREIRPVGDPVEPVVCAAVCYRRRDQVLRKGERGCQYERNCGRDATR